MDQYELKKYQKKTKNHHISDGHNLAFLGFFFIFLIAGQKTATENFENGLTHVFRCLAHLYTASDYPNMDLMSVIVLLQ